MLLQYVHRKRGMLAILPGGGRRCVLYRKCCSFFYCLPVVVVIPHVKIKPLYNYMSIFLHKMCLISYIFKIFTQIVYTERFAVVIGPFTVASVSFCSTYKKNNLKTINIRFLHYNQMLPLPNDATIKTSLTVKNKHKNSHRMFFV